MNSLDDAQTEKASILIVDDDDRLRSLLREILSINGYQVTLADSAQTALLEAERIHPDLIISDVMMPHIDGHKLFDDLKANPLTASIPFIFLSALSDPQHIIRGKQLGCDDYLTKPFDPAELLATIQGKLSHARALEESYRARLEAHNRRIINTLSHEFRTPLVAVKTGTELLLDNPESLDDKNIKKLIESIYRGSQRLTRLVDDFMLVQQIDSGYAAAVAHKLSKRVSLRTVATIAMDCFIETFSEPMMDSQKVPVVDLECESGEDDQAYAAHIYDIQVTNAIQRILSNAYKFGNPRTPVVVRLCSDEKTVSVKIIDRGPGLDRELISRACAMFEQLDRDRLEQQGCGLGLAIANYFTHINGGTTEFSTPADGVGLCVRLSFPRVFA